MVHGGDSEFTSSQCPPRANCCHNHQKHRCSHRHDLCTSQRLGSALESYALRAAVRRVRLRRNAPLSRHGCLTHAAPAACGLALPSEHAVMANGELICSRPVALASAAICICSTISRGDWGVLGVLGVFGSMSTGRPGVSKSACASPSLELRRMRASELVISCKLCTSRESGSECAGLRCGLRSTQDSIASLPRFGLSPAAPTTTVTCGRCHDGAPWSSSCLRWPRRSASSRRSSRQQLRRQTVAMIIGSRTDESDAPEERLIAVAPTEEADC